jgi:hypothetical protein
MYYHLHFVLELTILLLYFILQAARLLGLGPEKIVLLDNKTKILAKSQNTADLVQVRVILLL